MRAPRGERNGARYGLRSHESSALQALGGFRNEVRYGRVDPATALPRILRSNVPLAPQTSAVLLSRHTLSGVDQSTDLLMRGNV
jgi:hypothetical protein